MKRSEGKLNLLIGTALLSPALRLIPGSAAALGGTSAWLGPLAALPLALLYAALLQRLRRTLRPGECFPELILRTLSRRFGGALLLLFAGWLLLYTGFLLRAGADRLQITAYPRSGPGFFVLSMGLLLLTAALGPFRSLTRMARVVGPALFLVLLLMGLVPPSWPVQIVQVSINFIASMQYNTFRQAEGVPMATTFITNHVRQIGVQAVTSLHRHDRKAGKRALRHLLMIFMFFLGALILTPLCGPLQEKAIWVAALPLLVCFVVLVHADLGTEHELFDRKPHGH